MPRQYLFLPFDHRGSFEKGLLGIEGRAPNPKEVLKLKEFKQIIFNGILVSVRRKGVSKKELAVLTDETYGADVLKQAQKLKITTAMPVEKSGQDVFDFDEGAKFRKQIKRVNPDFVKALVRYNPDNAKDNIVQRKRLKELNDFLKKEKRKFLFELLVPATKDQQAKYGQSYDDTIRPGLMIKAIAELQKEGIRPTLWKIEGVNNSKDMESIVLQAQSVDKGAMIIVLGRGESEENVKRWLQKSAQVKGVEGFAVGRTVFMEPLKQYVAGKITKEQASEVIADNYLRLVAVWERLKNGKPVK